MSLASLENALVKELRPVLRNSKLTKNHVMEWSTSEETVKLKLNQDKEVYVFAPDLGLHCAVLKEADKRK